MDRRNFMGTMGAGISMLAAPRLIMAARPGESEQERDERLQWWREARFGMFIHWGIYSVAAGMWEGKRIERFPAEWLMFARGIPKEKYEPLAAQFNPVQFDAREWARIAKNAGMKYLVITSKHHDGFSMFDSALTDYDIMDASPFKRDALAELAQACADEGVRFGFYYSELDWRWAVSARTGWIPNFKKYLEFMKGQLQELFTNYGPIASVFFDGQWMPQWNDRVGRDMLAYCRDLAPGTVFNDRLGKLAFTTVPNQDPKKARDRRVGDYGTPEQYIPAAGISDDWETCMTMNDSWGFRSWDENWKSATELLRNLIDIVSKGGNFLLNVGPDSQGLIPAPSVERLAAMGEWLQVNGESIYGAQAGPVQGAKWGRSTRKDKRIFLHVFDWPSGELVVEKLGEPVKRAYLLADAADLPLSQDGGRLAIKLPAQAPCPVASVVVLEV